MFRNPEHSTSVSYTHLDVYKRQYQTLLVSQKYVDTIKEDFFTSHPEASYADWSAYFEDWKNQLVSDQ